MRRARLEDARIKMVFALFFAACGGRSVVDGADGDRASGEEASSGGTRAKEEDELVPGGAPSGSGDASGESGGNDGRAGGHSADDTCAKPLHPDPECRGIKSNAACALDGKECNLRCGFLDSGTRTCRCDAGVTWACSACDFSTSGMQPFPDVTTCGPDVIEGASCPELWVVCGAGTEACACVRPNDLPECGQSWDCGKPPPAPGSW
jgi:hypothetical protein